jgi:hypothetical protein
LSDEEINHSVSNGNPARIEWDCPPFLRLLGSAAGEIDNSVLVAFGETCTFAGALFGVDYTYKIKMVDYEKGCK